MSPVPQAPCGAQSSMLGAHRGIFLFRRFPCSAGITTDADPAQFHPVVESQILRVPHSSPSLRRVGVFGSFFFRVLFLSPYNLTFQLQIWNFSFLRLFNTDSKSNPSHPFAKTTKG